MKTKKLDIIYQDKHIIVINKPNGLLTIATDKEKQNTLYHQLLVYERQKLKSNRVFVIHRLDKDTSGLVMFAKNEKTKKILQDNWDDLVKYRGYVAVVNDQVKTPSGEIRSYLKENKALITYSTNDKSGKLAITRYKVLKTNKNYSLLDIEILTGRKNQIRVHLKDINHPVVGDKKYGINVKLVKRMYLHAYKLEFVHPISKELVKLELDIPKEFFNLVGGSNEK